MKSLFTLFILGCLLLTGCMGPVIIAYDTALTYDTANSELGGVTLKQPKTGNMIKDLKVDSVKDDKALQQDELHEDKTKGVLDPPEFMNEPNTFITPVELPIDQGWKKKLLQ